MIREIITHELRIGPTIRPISLKRRLMREEKVIAIKQEVGKLIDTNFIKEI